MTTKADQPAFPTVRDTFYQEKGQVIGPDPGLTKREYVAAQVFQGFCSDSIFRGVMHERNGWGPKEFAALAVEYSDALLEALEKP